MKEGKAQIHFEKTNTETPHAAAVSAVKKCRRRYDQMPLRRKLLHTKGSSLLNDGELFLNGIMPAVFNKTRP